MKNSDMAMLAGAGVLAYLLLGNKKVSAETGESSGFSFTMPEITTPGQSDNGGLLTSIYDLFNSLKLPATIGSDSITNVEGEGGIKGLIKMITDGISAITDAGTKVVTEITDAGTKVVTEITTAGGDAVAEILKAGGEGVKNAGEGIAAPISATEGLISAFGESALNFGKGALGVAGAYTIWKVVGAISKGAMKGGNPVFGLIADPSQVKSIGNMMPWSPGVWDWENQKNSPINKIFDFLRLPSKETLSATIKPPEVVKWSELTIPAKLGFAEAFAGSSPESPTIYERNLLAPDVPPTKPIEIVKWTPLPMKPDVEAKKTTTPSTTPGGIIGKMVYGGAR